MKNKKYVASKDKEFVKSLAQGIYAKQDALLKLLEKVPVISAACKQLNIGRATYYRWRSESEIFRKLADHAIEDGVRTVSDLAEYKLIEHIKNGNLTSIIFWLKSRNYDFGQKYYVLPIDYYPMSPMSPEVAKQVDEIHFPSSERPQKKKPTSLE